MTEREKRWFNQLAAKDAKDEEKKSMENNKKIIERSQMKNKINDAHKNVEMNKTTSVNAHITDTKTKKKEKDQTAPKRPLSAFFWFCEAKRPVLRAENPRLKMGEVSRELTKMWMGSDRGVKAEFEDQAEKDRQRYDKEIAVYNLGRKKPQYHRKPLREENRC